ncbi:MAG: glycosyltransferase family 87 protein [Solirubrobacteraceae bacterium]
MSARVDLRQIAAALKDVASVLVLGVLPVALLVYVLYATAGGKDFLYDFHGGLYEAARSILDGHDPYRYAFLARLARVASTGGQPDLAYSVPVYPAPALLFVTPLGLLPFKLAGLIYAVASIAALLAGLRILGVRDWRCCGVALLSWPVIHSIRLGQAEGLLLLGLAVAWRWRDRLWPLALSVAAIVVAKLFLLPVALWLLVTRRIRVLVTAALAGIAFLVVGWAVVGFDSFADYPRMLSNLSKVEGPAGVSLVSLAGSIGVANGAGEIVGYLGAAGLLAIAWRAYPARIDERSGFALAVVAALIGSPLVWPHYLALEFVPIALISPRFSPLWLVPLLAWIAPVEVTNEQLGSIAPYLLIELIVLTAVLTTSLRKVRGAAEVRAS